MPGPGHSSCRLQNPCVHAALCRGTPNTARTLTCDNCCLPVRACPCRVQLIIMYWSLLQLGRRLVLPAEYVAVPSAIAYEEVLQFHDSDLDVVGTLTVNLMFPATEGTISRLMNSWWDAKVRADGAAVLLREFARCQGVCHHNLSLIHI